MRRNIPDKKEKLQLIKSPKSQNFLTRGRRLSDQAAFAAPPAAHACGGIHRGGVDLDPASAGSRIEALSRQKI
jgi:hypothetical protein